MKIKKAHLKSLIKECLVEILSEGLGEDLNETIKQRPRIHTRSNSLNENAIVNNKGKRLQPTSLLTQAVNEVAQGDSILADILSDTATVTLPNMRDDREFSSVARALNPNHRFSEPGINLNELSNITGVDNANNKWAELAFLNSKPRLPRPQARKLTQEELNKKIG